MGDIRSAADDAAFLADPKNVARGEPMTARGVIVAQQTKQDVAPVTLGDLYNDITMNMQRQLMDNVFGTWRKTNMNIQYIVFDKRTKDFEECANHEEALGIVERWLDDDARMEDITVYGVDCVQIVAPSPGFKLTSKPEDDDA